MKFLSSAEVLKRLEGSIDGEIQAEERGVALTAASIHRLESPARLDFAGSEHEPATTTEVAVEKRDPQDTYGWWLLEEGTYLLHLNEEISLPGGALGIVGPHPRLLEGGASHPAVHLPGGRQVHRPVLPLTVCERGLALQENGRVSILVVAS